ncbi:MAG: HDOD domain-containing protein [Rubrivivax sp.]
MGWLSRLFGSQPAAPAPAARPAAVAATSPAASSSPAPSPVAVEPEAAPAPPLLCWLLDVAAPAQAALSEAERQALQVLDRVLAQPVLPPELLPRAANVVPQLIAMLRQDDLPVPVLAERIGKDPALAAEVLRMAGSSFYGQAGPVQDLAQAIQRLGVDGLQMAISRVVLRPLYQAREGSLTALAAPRLWAHADALSRHGAEVARKAGLPAFDGYLAGLLHDGGWTVLFHALQRADVGSLAPLSIEGTQAFEQRAHHLFGRAAALWPITPGFAAFAAEAQTVPLQAAAHPLAVVLHAAQGPCRAELAAG